MYVMFVGYVELYCIRPFTKYSIIPGILFNYSSLKCYTRRALLCWYVLALRTKNSCRRRVHYLVPLLTLDEGRCLSRFQTLCLQPRQRLSSLDAGDCPRLVPRLFPGARGGANRHPDGPKTFYGRARAPCSAASQA